MTKVDTCIMIIDDDLSDLELIKRAFLTSSKKGRLVCVNNGKEALAYLRGEGEFANRVENPYPTMLLSDIKMPEVDGFEILEHLQNNPTWAIVPTVILSSSEDPDDIRTAYKLGAFSYFVKPYRFEDLCELIKSLLMYWQSNTAPHKDDKGRLMMTDSKGKLGARYGLPN